MDSHIIFAHAGHDYTRPDGTSVYRKVITGVGRPLPPGMAARYVVTIEPDGTERVCGHIQARDKHGRRYFT